MKNAAFAPKIPPLDVLKQLAEKGCEFWQLNPDHLANIAYIIHVLADKDYAESPSAAVARKTFEEFVTLEAPLETPGGMYLHKVRALLVSFSNDISRQKREFVEKMRDAIEDSRDSSTRYQRGKESFYVLRSLIKMIPAAGLGTVGGIIAYMSRGAVSIEIASKTGTIGPSVAIGIVVTIIAGYIGYRLDDHRRNRISARLQLRKTEAWYAYAQTRLLKMRLHLQNLHEVWYEYTKIPYWVPVEASYTSLIEDEIRLGMQLQKHLYEFERPFQTFLRRLLEAIRTGRKHNGDIDVSGIIRKAALKAPAGDTAPAE
jgi:hypothetical protein